METKTELTTDTTLYTLCADFNGYTLIDGFLGNQTPEEFVSISRSDPATANLRGAALADVEAPEFIDTARAYIHEGAVWMDEDEAETALAEKSRNGEWVTGELTEFTLRSMVADIIEAGESETAAVCRESALESESEEGE